MIFAICDRFSSQKQNDYQDNRVRIRVVKRKLMTCSSRPWGLPLKAHVGKVGLARYDVPTQQMDEDGDSFQRRSKRTF